MNVHPGHGGQQPKMRDTMWGPDKTPQKMVLEDGRPQGLKLVLEETGICTEGMKRQSMINRLSQEEDFKSEGCQVIMYLRKKGDQALLYPKFH